MDATLNRGFDGRPEAWPLVPQNGGSTVAEYHGGGRVFPFYPGEAAPHFQVTFDFKRYLRTISKHRFLIGGTIAASLLFGLIVTLLMTPVYRATASIQIDREAINVVNVGTVQTDENTGGLDFFQTQYELLASRTLAERVVSTLGLTDDEKFAGQAEQSFVFTLGDIIFGSSAQDESSLESRTAKAVTKLQNILAISPVRGSRVVKIGIDHRRGCPTGRQWRGGCVHLQQSGPQV